MLVADRSCSSYKDCLDERIIAESKNLHSTMKTQSLEYISKTVRFFGDRLELRFNFGEKINGSNIIRPRTHGPKSFADFSYCAQLAQERNEIYTFVSLEDVYGFLAFANAKTLFKFENEVLNSFSTIVDKTVKAYQQKLALGSQTAYGDYINQLEEVNLCQTIAKSLIVMAKEALDDSKNGEVSPEA